jgi:hypothetical protein
MLEILDAAAELRRERDLVSEQLNFDQIKAGLRERLVAAARASGEPARPEEIEAALEQYFARMHAFAEPPPGLESMLAHAYVRRKGLLIGLAAAAAMVVATWGLFLRPTAPLAIVGRTQRAIARATAEIDETATQAKAIARDPATVAAVDKLRAEAATLAATRDAAGLAEARDRMAALEAKLEDVYEVEVVRRPGERSAIETSFTDAGGTRVSGYYVIVEAIGPGGKAIPRAIRNEESGRTKTVETWAERVPKAVYDRLAVDKKTDGRLDEYVFAVKRRGELEEVVEMKGPDGASLPRLGQITEW